MAASSLPPGWQPIPRGAKRHASGAYNPRTGESISNRERQQRFGTPGNIIRARAETRLPTPRTQDSWRFGEHLRGYRDFMAASGRHERRLTLKEARTQLRTDTANIIYARKNRGLYPKTDAERKAAFSDPDFKEAWKELRDGDIAGAFRLTYGANPKERRDY